MRTRIRPFFACALGELQQLVKTAAEERVAALILDRSSGFLRVLSPPFSFFRALRSFQIRFGGVWIPGIFLPPQKSWQRIKDPASNRTPVGGPKKRFEPIFALFVSDHATWFAPFSTQDRNALSLMHAG
jgi:hypothetical protein